MKRGLLILILMGLFVAGCGNATSENQNTNEKNSQMIKENDSANVTESENTEQEAYVVKFENAVTTEGTSISSEVFSNAKLTMVNVWATFCAPCINEMPALGEIANSYDAADFQMLGIVSDAVEDDETMLADAKEIIEETGADYPHLLLNEQLYMNLVGASDSVPTTYFLNRKGEVLGYLVGAQSKEVWEEIIDGLLEEVE